MGHAILEHGVCHLGALVAAGWHASGPLWGHCNEIGGAAVLLSCHVAKIIDLGIENIDISMVWPLAECR